MPSRKLQYRLGGLKICQSCNAFEAECAPYLYLFGKNAWGNQERTSKIALHPTQVTLFGNFAELRKSADQGCHFCLIWHKAIMNECHSSQHIRALLDSSQECVRMETPSFIATTDPFSAHVKILSPVRALVRVAHSAIWNYDDGKARIEMDPQLEILWDRIREQLENCRLHHISCNPPGSRVQLPSRLVHIHDEISVNVCDTAGLPEGFEYAALSYAWGGDQNIKLTVGEETSLRQAVAQSRLPQTLRDTFKTCRLLGLSYVWIDALCIYQDDGGVDFQKESAKMDHIYGLATITIVAASALTVTEGFLMVRELEKDRAVKTKRTTFAEGRLFINRKGLSEVRAKSPLALRGWCFQEEQLSKRLLYCTGHGLFWSCAEATFAEHCNPKGDIGEFESVVTTADPHFFLKSPDRLYIWDQLVEQYSVRNLTMTSDRLPAISGLASSIEEIAQEKLLFGMWPSRLPVQLLWITLDMKAAKVELNESRRIALQRIPSWSWASTPPMQAVQMPGSQISYSTAKLEQIDATNGYLRLRGRMRPLLLDHIKLASWPVKGNVWSKTTREFEETEMEAMLWAHTEVEIFVREEGRDPIVIQLDRTPSLPFEEFICFEINYKGLLLLEPDSEEGFKRVGCCQMHNDSAFFAGTEVQTIVLK